MTDLRDLLHRVAPQPERRLDIAELERRVSQRRARSRAGFALSVLLLVVFAWGLVSRLGDDDQQLDVAQSPEAVDPPPADLPELVAVLGCTELREIHPDVGPVRGAAERGLVCTMPDGELLHLFARSTDERLGSVESIDRVLGTGTSVPGCDVAVLVTEQFFVVAAPDALQELEDDVGTQVRPIAPTSPTVSYLDASCDLSPAVAWPEPTDIQIVRGPSNARDRSSTTSSEDVTDPIITVVVADSIMQAQVGGTLALEDGCTYLVGSGGERTVGVWPAGTSWRTDPPAVVLADGTELTLGASVVASGGYYEGAGPPHRFVGDASDHLQRCMERVGSTAAVVLQNEIEAR